MFRLPWRKRRGSAKKRNTSVVVYDLPASDAGGAGAAVRGREVAIFRPPVMLDPQGRTLPGVSKDLVARHLVSTTAALADADLGPVTVEWKAQEGRFMEATFTIQAWGQSVDIVHPIAPVSQKLANAWEMYKSGVALKVRELHKGHQRFGQANDLIRRASRQLEKLRDDDLPHFNDAEYLFLQTGFQHAIVMSALVPVGKAEPEAVIGTRASVS
jgi:hypothetical protein